jgi:FAD/FMN-containing dehydrogenase
MTIERAATTPLTIDTASVLPTGRFAGEVVLRRHAAYDQARRVLDAGVDRYPAMVVRPATAEDVIGAVNLARDLGLELAIKSGGHSPAGFGTCDGGVVIDFSAMRSIELDLEAGTVRIEPGATWGEVALALHPHGLAISSGDFGSVGVGGLTTGGGIGWMVREVGLTVDHLLAADVVLADGTLVRASEEQHPDLFWAIRGGGGNFGVVVSLLFRPHPAGMITGGMIIYDGADLARVVRGFADYCPSAPDELTAMVDIMQAPPMPFLPTERHGSLIACVTVCCTGDPERARRAIDPLRSLAEPIVDTIAPMPYPAMYAFTDHALPPNACFEVRSCFLEEMDEDFIDSLVAKTTAFSSPFSLVQLRALGGELVRKPADSVAFSHRDKPFLALLAAIWTDPAESARHHAYAEDFWLEMAPHARGAYIGFLGDEGEERKRSAYSPKSYRRLTEIKAKYDPQNLFHSNHNIEPATTPGLVA